MQFKEKMEFISIGFYGIVQREADIIGPLLNVAEQSIKEGVGSLGLEKAWLDIRE